MDFLLKSDQFVIEAKITRQGRDNKEIANELTIDAARYRTHPDCKSPRLPRVRSKRIDKESSRFRIGPCSSVRSTYRSPSHSRPMRIPFRNSRQEYIS